MRYILKFSCPDAKGILATVTRFLADHGAFIHDSEQFGDPETKTFFMRCVFTTEIFSKEKFSSIAKEFQANWEIHTSEDRPKTIIMVSKISHCINDLLHRWKTNVLPIDIQAIVSNHANLQDLAEYYKVPFHHMPVTKKTKQQQEDAFYKLHQSLNTDLVILARYMQILSSNLTQKLYGKAINIHHSFLPSFKGAKPYHQAHMRGVKLIGATAHYVTDDLDEGPIIEQEVLRVNHNLTPQQLTHAGWDIESRVLARAVKYHIEHRVFVNGNKTVVFA